MKEDNIKKYYDDLMKVINDVTNNHIEKIQNSDIVSNYDAYRIKGLKNAIVEYIEELFYDDERKSLLNEYYELDEHVETKYMA